MKIELEFQNADELIRKIRDELSRLGLTEKFMYYAMDYMDTSILKELKNKINNKLLEREQIRLRAPTNEDLQKYMSYLNPDEKEFLRFIISSHGRVTKKDVVKNFNWEKMKIAGLIAGITRIAKTLGIKPPIERSYERVNSKWDIVYTIRNDYIEFLKRSL